MINEHTIIIGCGPCGMSTALSLQKNNIDPLIIEKGNIVNTIYKFPTHQTFFSSSHNLEIGNMPFISSRKKPVRNEALAYYREVAMRNNLRINPFEKAVTINKENDKFIIKTKNIHNEEKIYKAKYVVIATGYYDQPNLLTIEGENLPHVMHYFKEAHPYYKKQVTVIGGKNSSIDTALELYHAHADVTVLYRGSDYSKSIKPWILPDFKSLVDYGKIKMIFDANITRIKKDSIEYHAAGKDISISADFVFAMIGYHPDTLFLESAGINIDKLTGRPQFNHQTYETNINNLYVAGVIISGLNGNETFIENGRLHGLKIANDIIEKNNKE